MADSEQVIRLTGKENIHAIRGLVSRAQAPRVLLVVPEKHGALVRLVRLKILARQAFEEGYSVALVTRDPSIRELARQVGLSTFGSIEEGRKAHRWGSGQAAVVPAVNSRGGAVEWARGRRAVLERSKQIGTRSNWGEHIMLAGLVFGMMIVLSAVLLLLVPSARITLVPRQQPLEVTFPVLIDPTAREIDFGDFVVPGRVIRQDVQGTIEIATSGRRDVPAETAKGRILFINVTGQPVSIPVGTILSTSSGTPVRFRTTEAISLPGTQNASASVPIEAVSPGPSGNVGPQQINRVEGAAATVVRALNEAGTEGGTVQQRAVVTAADREQLHEQLQQRLLQEGRAALERGLEGGSSDDFLVEDIITMELTAENYNGSVDDQLDVVSLNMRARVSAIVVNRRDLDRLAKRRLEAAVPPTYRMLDDGFLVVPGNAAVIDAGLPSLAVAAQAIAGAELSGDEIRTLVRGQPIIEAQAALLQRLPLAADPLILVSPDWWDRMPYLPLRIFIRVGVLGAEQAPQEPSISEN